MSRGAAGGTGRGDRVRTLVPGYPAVHGGAQSARVCLTYSDLFGGAGAVAGRHGRPVSIFWC